MRQQGIKANEQITLLYYYYYYFYYAPSHLDLCMCPVQIAVMLNGKSLVRITRGLYAQNNIIMYLLYVLSIFHS